MTHNSRQLAFLALRAVRRGAFADVALDKVLSQTELSAPDRRLVTELVYGSVRRQRSLDAMIDQLAKKKATQQPPDLRTILHLGFYQLRYLSQIPASAAVNTTVDLAKQNGFAGLAGFVNGLLRQYLREGKGQEARDASEALAEPCQRLLPKAIRQGQAQGAAPTSPLGQAQGTVPTPILAEQLGILHSYPDWIVQIWLEQLGLEETEQLCEWMNQPPHIDLRVNLLRASVAEVEATFQASGIAVSRVPHVPQALRLQEPGGAVQQLPGFEQGWWMVQDASAQLVAHLLDPQPGEFVVDACAAPGGKTMHIAELMQDQGTIWACDRTASRLKKLQQNCDRLGLHSIQICEADSREMPQFANRCDRVLLDVPCSGLGTLHRHADARWRQTPETVQELSNLQWELLAAAAAWVKPKGVLVYATCTLHPTENETMIQKFITHNPNWQIELPPPESPFATFASPAGWAKLWSHHHNMDGFFMVRLKKS